MTLTVDNLTPSQRAALEAMFAWLRSNESEAYGVLTGNAGTGKTTLMRLFVEGATDSCEAVCVCAPTHKALNVLREKINDIPCKFSTIHSVLGYKMDENDFGELDGSFGESNSIEDFTLLVVDECSMIDSKLLEFLVTHKPDRLRVLFVGDPAQLPPVNDAENDASGTSPVFKLDARRFHLTEIVRQAADNPIIRLAQVIRDAQSSFERVTLDAVLAAADDSDGRAGRMPFDFAAICEWCARGVEQSVDTRIVAFRNDRVIAYNTAIHKRLYPDCRSTFAVGERVLVQEPGAGYDPDDDSRKIPLQTNEELTVVEQLPDGFALDFDQVPCERYILRRDDGLLILVKIAAKPAELQADIARLFDERRKTGDKSKSRFAWRLKKCVLNLRHAYALTAHKSQGSTFHTVFVDWHDMQRMRTPSDFNRGMYVAVTRASTNLAIAA